MRGKLLREAGAAGLPAMAAPGRTITSAEVEVLPEAAQRYLKFMGVVGQAQDWSFRIAFRGRFRRRPGAGWARCETWQYNHRPAVARIFHIRIRMGGILPVLARDLYLNGRGRLLVRVADWLTVADGKGDEFDIGELVTYLNDAVLLAPSMLLVPAMRWLPVDTAAFDLVFADQGREVRARVSIDRRGAPADFSTTDRYCADAGESGRLVRARWTTPVAGWQEVKGRRLPTSAQAIWHLPRGPYPYAEFQPVVESLAFNVPPGQ